MRSALPLFRVWSVALVMVLVVFLPFASAVDTDGDGHEDHNDDCPLAAGNSSVDRTGCPDADGDGTSDWIDRWSIPSSHFENVQTLSSSYDYYGIDHSPDGELVLTGDENGWVRIWNTSTHINMLSDQLSGAADAVAWSPDGSMVAASTNLGSGGDDELLIWWANNMTLRHAPINVDVESGNDDVPGSIAFNHDGSLIAVAIGRATSSGTNGEVKIINTSSGLEERSLNPGGEDRFDSVAWSPDGSRIALGGNDDMWIYDTVNWQQNRSMTGIAGSTIADIAWSPDGNWISTCESWGGGGSGAELYNVHTGSRLWTKTHTSSCMSTDFSPDSRMVAFAISYYQGDGASVRVYSTDNGSAEDTFSGPRPNNCAGSSGNQCGTVYGLSWAADGQSIVTGHGRNDEGLYFWKVEPDPDQDGWNTTDQGDGRVDHFPIDPTQWNDTDMDGYGDNPAPAFQPDSCVTTFGLSFHDRFGCPDTDGDGWSDPDGIWKVADGADAFFDDVTQWRDTDDDGYGDNYYFITGVQPLELHLNQSGDAFLNEPTQWNDSDGDGYGDNYNNASWANMFRCTEEIGCVGIYVANAVTPDAFPLDRYQWSDYDGDWVGDNPEGPMPDGCPGQWGDSMMDRLGCPDSDGDGWSNADGNESAHPSGEADAFPDDPTQWRDSDGDGFGDNQSGNNPDGCVYDSGDSWVDMVGCPDWDGDGWANKPLGGDEWPNDPTQWTDSDGDGYGDNWGDPLWNDSRGVDWPGVFIIGANYSDEFPLDPTQWKDSDGDGCGDNKVLPDGDWWPNDPTQCRDSDGDGFPDNPDGTNGDQCPTEAGEANEDEIRGCPDRDGDGYVDSVDIFPDNPFQWADEDDDGVGDNNAVASGDDCLDEYGTSSVSPLEGCPDNDGDGWADEMDAFPNDPLQWKDSDGDSYGDNYYWENMTVEDPLIAGNFITLRDEHGDAFPNEGSQWADRDGDGKGDNPNGSQPDAFPDRFTQNSDPDGDGYGNNVTLGAFQPDDCRTDYGTSWRDSYGCPDLDGDGQSDRNDICPYDKDFWSGSKDQCVITEAQQDDVKGSGEESSGIEPMFILAGVILLLLAALVIIQVAKQSARRKGKVLVSEDEFLELRGEHSREEEERKQKWIDYYLSQGMNDKAKELGWQDISELPQWKQYEIEQAAAAETPTMFDLDNL